jgi:hypothetical protein
MSISTGMFRRKQNDDLFNPPIEVQAIPRLRLASKWYNLDCDICCG